MEVKTYTETVSIESALKHLWEKVRIAAERISQLREQNETYRTHMEHLEQEIVRLRSELTQKEQEMKRLKADHSQLASSLGDNNILTPEEKESLKTRIKELIAKINSHL